MKIQELINSATEFILHFSLKKYENQIKIVVIALFGIAALLILAGATILRF